MMKQALVKRKNSFSTAVFLSLFAVAEKHLIFIWQNHMI